MTNPACGTAILYFSLSPEVQALEKHWQGVSKSLARKTHSKLFHHTSGIIRQSGLPCIHSDEHTQRGYDFGSKLSNAVEDVFSFGYSSVIILGNDCPQLNSEILKNAALQVNENKTIIGPAQNGGVYLMGFHRDKFDKTAFENLPWQTPSLQNSLLDYFNKNSERSVVLPFLADLNRYYDLNFFTGIKEISSRLILVFQALIQSLQHQYYGVRELTPSFLVASSKSRRGPPQSI